MSAEQPGLPGFDPPGPLAESRENLRRLRAAWEAVAHLPDSEERERLQPLYFKAVIELDRLESGPKWWHR